MYRFGDKIIFDKKDVKSNRIQNCYYELGCNELSKLEKKLFEINCPKNPKLFKVLQKVKHVVDPLFLIYIPNLRLMSQYLPDVYDDKTTKNK